MPAAVNDVVGRSAWRLDESAIGPSHRWTKPVLRASARTGEGVEEAFVQLATAILG
jgi:hypothetical protein